eukprot:2653046-Amphidinium_carterae.1
MDGVIPVAYADARQQASCSTSAAQHRHSAMIDLVGLIVKERSMCGEFSPWLCKEDHRSALVLYAVSRCDRSRS